MHELERLVRRFTGQVRLAPGLTGRATYIGVTALLVFAVLAFRIDTSDRVLVFGIIGAVVLVLLIVIIAVTAYAWRHPGPALLEGGDLIAYQQTEHAAKGVGALPPGPQTTNPQALPPAADEPED